MGEEEGDSVVFVGDLEGAPCFVGDSVVGL